MSDLVGNPEDRFSHNEAHIETQSNKSNTITYATSGDTDPILNRSASVGLRLDDCL